MSQTRRRAFLLGSLLLFGALMGFGGLRAWRAFHAYRRLNAAPGSALDVNGIRDFVPLAVIVRRYGVPETVLEDSLRRAGFSVEARRLPIELPQGVPGLPRPAGPSGGSGTPGAAGAGGPGAGGPGASGLGAPPRGRSGPEPPTPTGQVRRLDPSEQSLRQIAQASGRPPAEAVRVVQDIVREYWRDHPDAVPTPPARRGFPGRPPPNRGPTTAEPRPTPGAAS